MFATFDDTVFLSARNPFLMILNAEEPYQVCDKLKENVNQKIKLPARKAEKEPASESIEPTKDDQEVMINLEEVRT